MDDPRHSCPPNSGLSGLSRRTELLEAQRMDSATDALAGGRDGRELGDEN